MKVNGQSRKIPEILTLVDLNEKEYIDSFLMGVDRIVQTGEEDSLGCGTPSPMFLDGKNTF